MNNPYKSMYTYGEHAEKDAMQIAYNLLQECTSKEIIDSFYSVNISAVYGLDWIQESISNYIKRSESQRGAFYKKLEKELKASDWNANGIDKILGIIPILAIISLRNIQKAFDIRDNYCNGVVAGSGNRITCEAMNNIIFELAAIHNDKSFPIDVFEKSARFYGEYSEFNSLKEMHKKLLSKKGA